MGLNVRWGVMRYVSLYDPTIPMIVYTKCVNHKDNHAVVYDKQLRGYCVRCEIRDPHDQK